MPRAERRAVVLTRGPRASVGEGGAGLGARRRAGAGRRGEGRACWAAGDRAGPVARDEGERGRSRPRWVTGPRGGRGRSGPQERESGLGWEVGFGLG